MLLPLPAMYGCSCLPLYGMEVSFYMSILKPRESSFPFLHRVPNGDVKTGLCQVSPRLCWAALAAGARGEPTSPLHGRAQALVVMLTFLLPLLTLRVLQWDPGMGEHCPQGRRNQPWRGQEAATPLVYQRYVFKLGETESWTKILQSPWVPAMVGDADRMGLINTSTNWSPSETLYCSTGKFSFLKSQHQTLFCGIWANNIFAKPRSREEEDKLSLGLCRNSGTDAPWFRRGSDV